MSRVTPAHVPRNPDAEVRSQPLRLVRRNGRGLCVPECSRACLIRWIDFPKLPLQANIRETLRCGPDSLVVRAEIPLGSRLVEIAYTQFRTASRWNAFWKPSRAFRAWRLGHRLRECEVDTPRPLIAVTPRSFLRPVESYLATEWTDGVPLNEIANRSVSLPTAAREQLGLAVAEAAGRLLGRLHRERFRHRRLKPRNVLITGDLFRPSTIRALFIELEGVSRRRMMMSQAARLRELFRLHVLSRCDDITGVNTGVRLVRAYLAESGMNGWPWRDCWKQLAAEAQQHSQPSGVPARRAG